MQGNLRSLRERYKRWSMRFVDWYFAYTRLSVQRVLAAGVPHDRITCVKYAADTTALRKDLDAITPDELAQLRRTLALAAGPIGVFIGSLYSHKRIGFLIKAAETIRSRVGGFQLIVAGAGPDLPLVEAAVLQHGWIRYVGVRRGREGCNTSVGNHSPEPWACWLGNSGRICCRTSDGHGRLRPALPRNCLSGIRQRCSNRGRPG